MRLLNLALILVGPFLVVFGLESIVNRHVMFRPARRPLKATVAGVRLLVRAARRAAPAARSARARLVAALPVRLAARLGGGSR